MFPEQTKNKSWLERWIFISVFFLPVYLVRFPGFNLLDIFIVAVFFLWIFSTENKKEILGRLFFQNKLAVAGASLIVVGFFAGLLKTENFLASLGIIKSWIIFPLMLAVVFRTGVSEEGWKRLAKTVFYSATGVAFLSLIMALKNGLTYDGRLSGIFNSPNYLFMYLASGIIFGTIVLNETLEKKKHHQFLWNGLTLAFLVMVAFFAKAYAGILALLMAEGFLLRKFFGKRKIWLTILMVLFLGWVVFESDSEKFQSLISFDERSSFSSREIIWEVSVRIIQDNWFLGVGGADFQGKYLEYQKFFPPYLEWAVPHPHNLFLAFWLGGGILGLSGFLILIFNWIKISRRQEKKLLVGASVIILYFMLHGLFDTTYFKNDLACLFWLAYSFFLKLDPPDSSIIAIHEK